MVYGWALGYATSDSFEELGGEEPGYLDMEVAHKAAVDALRALVEAGFPYPEMLVGVVYDGFGDVWQTVTTRRVAGNN